MNLTEAQRAAVRTWRKGEHGSIVSDLPFHSNDRRCGGGWLVADDIRDEVIDFILAAARAAVGPEYHKNEDGERWACDQPNANQTAEGE